VLLISHNMGDIKAIADQVAVLRLGRNNGVFDVNTTPRNRYLRRDRRVGQCRCPPYDHARRGMAVNGGETPESPETPEPPESPEAPPGGVRRVRPYADAAWRRLRPGERRALPVMLGLVVIWLVFQASTTTSSRHATCRASASTSSAPGWSPPASSSSW